MNNRNIQYNKDQQIEQRVAAILDSFYTSRNIQFERVKDKERQVKGIDLILTTKSGKTINIDEKCKYYGLQNNKILESYSFEINRKCRDGIRRNGWFIDNAMMTDFYCYIFPQFEDPNDFSSRIKQPLKVELFSKKDIYEIIQAETTLAKIEQEANYMAMTTQRISRFKNFILYKTPAYKLSEEPINLLLSREIISKTKNFKLFYT